jgi:hypothetical protein
MYELEVTHKKRVHIKMNPETFDLFARFCDEIRYDEIEEVIKRMRVSEEDRKAIYGVIVDWYKA